MKRLIFLSLIALSACSTPLGGASIGAGIRWQCDGGHAFNVRFTRDSAIVALGGATYILRHAQSASGARYTNGSIEYWEHAGQVQLSGVGGGPYVNCRRR